MNKVGFLLLLTLMVNVSCADSKVFKLDGKDVLVEPYGWADSSTKNENIRYEVSAGNVVLSIIFSETIIAPVVFTGWYLFEPVELITIKQ